MKLRNIAFAAALMLSTTTVLAADSEGAFAVKGIGLSKCSVFVEAAKKNDKAVLWRYIGWLEGFITASNQHVTETFDLTPWQNIGTLTQMMASLCDRNADMRFGEAVVRFATTMNADRLTDRSALLPIEFEGKKHVVYEESMRRVQARLTELGLYTGDIDAKFNDATKQALKTFQAEHNKTLQSGTDGTVQSERKIPETGMPDQKTMFELLMRKREIPKS